MKNTIMNNFKISFIQSSNKLDKGDVCFYISYDDHKNKYKSGYLSKDNILMSEYEDDDKIGFYPNILSVRFEDRYPKMISIYNKFMETSLDIKKTKRKSDYFYNITLNLQNILKDNITDKNYTKLKKLKKDFYELYMIDELFWVAENPNKLQINIREILNNPVYKISEILKYDEILYLTSLIKAPTINKLIN